MSVVVRCEETGVEYQLGSLGAELSIGRHPKSCQVVLPLQAEAVSRIHAKLKWITQKELRLTDTSSYGSHVKGCTVTNASAELKDGDTFRIGQYHFVVVFPQEEKIQADPVRKRAPSEASFSSAKRNKPAASQRMMSDFFTARPSQVLAAETPLSQMGGSSRTFAAGGSFVTDSQFSDDDEDIQILPPQPKKKKVSLFDAQTSSNRRLPSETPLCMETAPSQMPRGVSQKNDGEVVASSQEDDDIMIHDGSDENKTDLWKDVNSQMDFQPLAHSTQRVVGKVTPAATQTKGRKKKSSIFQNANPPKNALPVPVNSSEKSFRLPPVQEFDPAPEPSFAAPTPPTRSTKKRSAFGSSQAPRATKTKSAEKPVEPKRSESSLAGRYDDDKSDQLEINTNFDYSCVSSGKKYDEDEPEQEKPRQTIKEKDVAKVVENMTQMIKFVDLSRSFDASSTRDVSVSAYLPSANTTQGGTNFKKFRKASQGRFNTSIPCISSALGGREDLVDFRQCRH